MHRHPSLFTRCLWLVVAGFAALGLAGCAEDTPMVPLRADGTPDPELVLGREVYTRRCASCHGRNGTGGTGPGLAGVVADTFPDPAEQRRVIAEGANAMPSFAGSLSTAEIDGVVRYTREVLSQP